MANPIGVLAALDESASAANIVAPTAISSLEPGNAFVSELQDIDRTLWDLRVELTQLEVRQQAALRRKEVLERECQARGLLSVGGSQPSTYTSSTSSCRSDTRAAPSEPMVFDLDSEGDLSDREGHANADALPLITSSLRPVDGGRSSKSKAHIEDWEKSLDAFGVAKCGVCGMKLPLDVSAIEQHSFECEETKRTGKKPDRRVKLHTEMSSALPRDRAAILRSKLAERTSGAKTPRENRDTAGYRGGTFPMMDIVTQLSPSWVE